MSIQIRNKFTVLAATGLLTRKNAMASLRQSTKKKSIEDDRQWLLRDFALEAFAEQGNDGFIVFAACPAERDDLFLDLAVLEDR